MRVVVEVGQGPTSCSVIVLDDMMLEVLVQSVHLALGLLCMIFEVVISIDVLSLKNIAASWLKGIVM